MMDQAMTEPGEGERALRRRSRQVWTIIGILAATGGALGFTMALLENDEAGWPGTLPGWWAIVAAAVWVLAVTLGNVVYTRRVDEVERTINVRAGNLAAALFVIGYPAWYLLWKGGLVAEPRHEILFAVTLAAMLLAYLWQKLRS